MVVNLNVAFSVDGGVSLPPPPGAGVGVGVGVRMMMSSFLHDDRINKREKTMLIGFKILVVIFCSFKSFVDLVSGTIPLEKKKPLGGFGAFNKTFRNQGVCSVNDLFELSQLTARSVALVKSVFLISELLKSAPVRSAFLKDVPKRVLILRAVVLSI